VESREEIIRMRRRQIFEATCEVIARKGFHRATIREIAQEADIGKGTIYEYISRKEDLLTLIIEEGLNLMAEQITDAISEETTAEGKLKRAIKCQIELIEEYSSVAKAIAIEIDQCRNNQQDAINKIVEDRYLSIVKAIIDTGVKEGVFESVDSMVMADIVSYCSFLWAHSGLLHSHASSPERYTEVLTNLIFHGLLKKSN